MALAKKIQILVVENEPIIAAEIAMIVEDLGYEVCGEVLHAADVEPAFLKCEPDLILMDINLGKGKDGISLMEDLNKIKKTPFIFVTSYADKATLDRAKKLNPDGYVVKPFDDKDLQAAIEIAFSRFESTQPQYTQETTADDNFLVNKHLFIRHNSKLVRLLPQDILYAEAKSNYTQIVTADVIYTLSSHLAIIERKLAAFDFFRVHRSFIVNLNHVDAVEADQVFIKEKSIPLSRTAKPLLLERITQL